MSTFGTPFTAAGGRYGELAKRGCGSGGTRESKIVSWASREHATFVVSTSTTHDQDVRSVGCIKEELRSRFQETCSQSDKERRGRVRGQGRCE